MIPINRRWFRPFQTGGMVASQMIGDPEKTVPKFKERPTCRDGTTIAVPETCHLCVKVTLFL